MPGSNPRLLLIFILLIFTVYSCKFQRILKSDDHELMYQKAIEYYEEGDYNRAIRLFSEVIRIYRGTARAEDINYYYAMAHYKQGDYILASHYFKSFVSIFPRSKHAEEFTFLSAYCKYLQSPRYSLDQTVTREAVQEFQKFINRYPHSEHVEKANELIDELRLKLEKKRFEIARLYYDINDFRAAIRTFENLIYDFPGTVYEEKALFYIVKSYHDFARMSIPERQPERYEKTIEAHNRLVRHYPESEFLDEADRLLNNSKKQLENIHKPAEVVLTEPD